MDPSETTDGIFTEIVVSMIRTVLADKPLVHRIAIALAGHHPVEIDDVRRPDRPDASSSAQPHSQELVALVS